MKIINNITLQANESTPTLAIDIAKDIIYVATAGYDKIFKFSSDLKHLGIAVLPNELRLVSSLYFINDTLYIVTSEPNAAIGRIIENNFCDIYCSDFGYCNNSRCLCIKDYDKDPINHKFVCVPTHYIRDQDTIIYEQELAASFGILFGFAIIACIAGWFLYAKSKSDHSKYKPLNLN